MTPDEIREVFDSFIEYPEGSEKLYVTTASTLIFARHIAKIAAEREREACAKVCEESAAIIDAPSLYMGGPSNTAKRKAQQFADAIRARSTP